MNEKLHGELAALIRRYYSEEISDEEQALLQVHLAFCGVYLLEFEHKEDGNT